MKSFLILFFTTILSISNAQKGIVLVNASTFDNLIELGNHQLLDVRTSDEFKSGYIKGAINIDFWDPAFMELVKERFDKSLPLMIYCAGGGRSGMAANNLRKKGFKTIYDLEGGYESYTE